MVDVLEDCSMVFRAWALAALVVGCSESRPAAKAAACPTPSAVPTASVAPVASAARSCEPCAPTAVDAGAGTAPTNPTERFYPGSDSARTAKPWTRYPTAVLLFAAPRHEDVESLSRIETLSFQPVICAIGGKLHTGARCGEVMPRRTTVRLTAASSGDDTMEVLRSTTPFVANPDDGPVTFPAPYAPACCMYKRCEGKTIPYRPVERPGMAFATSKTILAVWPEDADIDLVPMTPETEDATKRSWKLERPGPRKLLQLSTSDLDHDGRPETLVYEQWANDYGLDVFANGAAAPAYRFSCGNI